MTADPPAIRDAGRPIRIGISSCLLGEHVRYDGGHKHDRFLTGTLGRYLEWVPVCPEVELGLGIPRETIRLVQIWGEVRLVTQKSGRDLTDEMRDYAGERVRRLAKENLCGYILKSDSPSCGMLRVRVFSASRMAARNGIGFFARELLEHCPDLPIEEEGRLSDPILRENWIERVFAYRRLRTLWESRWTVKDLIAFHTACRLILLAHSPKAFQRVGRLVAGAKGGSRQELKQRYQAEFMASLKIVATRGRHANVLRHMAGHFKKKLDEASRRELNEQIEDYRKGFLPLIVPLTLLKQHVRRLGEPYLEGQIYLNPHPSELALRNHVSTDR